MIKKLKSSVSLVKHRSKFVFGNSYYPEQPRKSRLEIFFDQLSIIWKYGSPEPFYFTYGFDRQSMSKSCMEEYLIPYSSFQSQINTLNFCNPKYGQFHGRTITADKYYFSIFLSHIGIPTPQVLLYVKNHEVLFVDAGMGLKDGVSTDEALDAFLSIDMDAFCKPADGQLGNGIFGMTIKQGIVYIDGTSCNKDDVKKMLLSADYLVQKRIYQHPKMAELCDSTINSIRLQTVLDSNGNVIPFGAGLRIGRHGGTVDNWAKGGVFVGINMETGTLMDRGFLKPMYGTSVFAHPDSHVAFEGFEIPYFQEALRMAQTLHRNLYRCHSVGWDIAITEDGPVFIEGNGWWEISLIQAAHGGLKQKIGSYFGVTK